MILKKINAILLTGYKEEIKEMLQDANNLLKQVGPGEWRWKLRIKQKEVTNKLVKIKNNEQV